MRPANLIHGIAKKAETTDEQNAAMFLEIAVQISILNESVQQADQSIRRLIQVVAIAGAILALGVLWLVWQGVWLMQWSSLSK